MADWAPILPRIAALIEAPYSVGDFEAAEDQFVDSGEEEGRFSVEGKSGASLVIHFEKYEGYFFGTLTGEGAAFEKARSEIRSAYLGQGGAP